MGPWWRKENDMFGDDFWKTLEKLLWIGLVLAAGGLAASVWFVLELLRWLMRGAA